MRARAQGATRKGHPLQTKGSWRDPKPNTRNKTIATEGGDQPSALEGHPLALTRARAGGRARSPVLALFGEITYSGFLEKAWPQTQQKGKTKTTKEKHRNTLAASRPKKGLGRGEASSSPVSSRRIQKTRGSSRRIQKTRGAQNGTPRKHQRSRTHGQKGR